MNRTHPLLRLTPEVAGKLQHDYDRAAARLKQLEIFHAELEHQIRSILGKQTLWSLRTSARNAVLARQLAAEIAA